MPPTLSASGGVGYELVAILGGVYDPYCYILDDDGWFCVTKSGRVESSGEGGQVSLGQVNLGRWGAALYREGVETKGKDKKKATKSSGATFAELLLTSGDEEEVEGREGNPSPKKRARKG